MSQKTDAELTTEAQVIRDETTEGANTKTRVYNVLKNLIDSKPNNSDFASVDTTGTAISFAVPQNYGTDGAPETGNITIVTTGLIKGMTQLLIHNNGTTPTFGSPIKIISGAYATGELNYIMLLAVSTTSILVTISQEV